MIFNGCTVFVIVQSKIKSETKILRISEDAKTQELLNNLFSDLFENYTMNLSPIEFDGKYVPQEDDKEYLYIKDYVLCKEICDAIQNPLGIEIYKKEKDCLPLIKALFIGQCVRQNGMDCYEIAFQKFRNDQYITKNRIHLLLSGDTFSQDNRVGISIGKKLDIIYRNKSLLFRSYYYARQILDLSDYYREASDADIEYFTSDKKIECYDSEEYLKVADSWERKKIAGIIDSNVLVNFSTQQIKKKAASVGVVIDTKKDRIIIPSDKKQRKLLLGFLDEEVYRGTFSNIVFQTNSKRRARIKLNNSEKYM